MAIEVIADVLRRDHIRDKGLLLVLIALANHANRDGGDCFPSLATIAAESRHTKRGAIIALQRLEAMGEIIIQRRPNPGRGHSNCYQVCMERVNPATVKSHGKGELDDRKRVNWTRQKGEPGDRKRVNPATQKGELDDVSTNKEPSNEPSLEPSNEPSGEPCAASAPTGSKLSAVCAAIEGHRYADRCPPFALANPGREGAAVKACTASVQDIADAYVAAATGQWGGADGWLRTNLSLFAVCNRIAGFLAWRQEHRQKLAARAAPIVVEVVTEMLTPEQWQDAARLAERNSRESATIG